MSYLKHISYLQQLVVLTVVMILLSACNEKSQSLNSTSNYVITSSVQEVTLKTEINSNVGSYYDLNFISDVFALTYDGDFLDIITEPGSPELNLTIHKVIENSRPGYTEVYVECDTCWFLNSEETRLRFITGNADGSDLTYTDVPVTLKSRLQVGSTDVSFAHEIVRDQPQSTSFDIRIIGNEKNNNEWVLTTESDVITIADSKGSGATTVSFTVTTSGDGVFEEEIIFRDMNDNFSQTIRVRGTSVKLDSNQLKLDRYAIALTENPEFSGNLSASIKVEDTYALSGIAWQATTNTSWLSLSENGLTGESLEVTANPMGLALNQLHRGKITISSDTFDSTEIEVSLWVHESPVTSGTIFRSFDDIKADPLRPLVYVNNSNTIVAYNIYSREIVSSLMLPASNLRAMNVTPKADKLFAFDESSQTVFVVDLETFLEIDSFRVEPQFHGNLASFYKVNKLFVMDGSSTIYDGDTFEKIEDQGIYGGGSAIALSRDADTACSMTLRVSPYSVHCSKLEYLNEVGVFQRESRFVRGSGSNGKDIAVSHDGTRFVTASGSPYRFDVYDIESLQVVESLPADAYPVAIEIGPHGDIFGAASVAYGPTDFWHYGTDSSLVSSTYVSGYASGVLDQALAVSAGGDVTVLLTSDSKVVFLKTKR